MKSLLLLFLSLFSGSLFAQTEVVVEQGNEKLIILGFVSILVTLLICYIIALIKTRKGEMVVFVNMYDFVLMFSSYIFLLSALFFANELSQVSFWLLIALFFASFITSMVWSVLANNKDVKLGILAVLAKLFLMVIIWLIIILYLGYTARKTTKRENGQERGLTAYEQMREDQDVEKRKAFALKLISTLFLSLIVGTTAYKNIMRKNDVDQEKVNDLIRNVNFKKLLYIFLGVTTLIFLIGYGASYWHLSKNNEPVQSQVQADTLIEDKAQSQENQWTPKSVSTPEFDEFFKKFNTDKSFQLSKIIFPITISIDEMGEISQKTIAKNKWEFDEIDENSDMYYVIKTVEGDNATVWLSGKENGINVEYFFEKRNEKWFLVSMKDSSD
ncbi:DUF4348 domain-containing protein [Capnocytophaga cynodegmi]|uniref:DUF4348 domain-containing protein n=1 Tax=Capnocytophaga cynodegmi TaxID=28189 RepID=UPI00385DC744